MMDLRYHLASLMSVFLALAVGIVVGVSLGSSERQEATIRSLQLDVAAIRAEDSQLKEVNADLQHRLTAREAAEQQDLLPLVVHGRLAGHRVALLLTGGDAVEALRAPVTRALRLAGADLLILRLPRGGGAARADQDQAGGTRKPGAGNNSHPSSTARGAPDGAGAAARTLGRALIEGRPALLDAARARMPALEVIGDLRAPIHRLLLLCPNDQPDYARRVAAGGGIEAALAHVAQQAGALLVAAEPEPEAAPDAGPGSADGSRSHEATSLLPALTGLGAATVDDIDTTAGQIAAVLALAGARGNFGSGPSATRLLPPVESAPASLLPHP